MVRGREIWAPGTASVDDFGTPPFFLLEVPKAFPFILLTGRPLGLPTRRGHPFPSALLVPVSDVLGVAAGVTEARQDSRRWAGACVP